VAEYPNNIKTFRRVVNRDLSQGILGDIVLAEDHNEKAEEIEAIEQTLGINPQGSFSTVKDRLDDIEKKAQYRIRTGYIDTSENLTGLSQVDKEIIANIPIKNGEKYIAEVTVQLYHHATDSKANIIPLISIDGGGYSENGTINRCMTDEATQRKTYTICTIPATFTGNTSLSVGVRIRNIYSILYLEKIIVKVFIWQE